MCSCAGVVVMFVRVASDIPCIPEVYRNVFGWRTPITSCMPLDVLGEAKLVPTTFVGLIQWIECAAATFGWYLGRDQDLHTRRPWRSLSTRPGNCNRGLLKSSCPLISHPSALSALAVHMLATMCMSGEEISRARCLNHNVHSYRSVLAVT